MGSVSGRDRPESGADFGADRRVRSHFASERGLSSPSRRRPPRHTMCAVVVGCGRRARGVGGEVAEGGWDESRVNYVLCGEGRCPGEETEKRGGADLKERDLEVLEFVVRFGVVPRSAVAVWANTGRSVTFDRERRLREAELIEVHPAFGAAGSLLVATPLSLRVCECEELRPPRLSAWTARHSMIVARVAARLRARRRAAAFRARDRRRRAIRRGADLLGRAGRSTAALSPPRSDSPRPGARGDRGRADEQGPERASMRC